MTRPKKTKIKLPRAPLPPKTGGPMAVKKNEAWRSRKHKKRLDDAVEDV
jgi:hypothetical protein